MLLLWAAPIGPAAAQGLPSADELHDSVAARYAMLRTYRDRGVMKVEGPVWGRSAVRDRLQP